MGYDDEHAVSRLILDIETIPLTDAARYLEPVDAPSNYKDPIKIEEYVRTKEREQLERAALDPDLCRVVAIGSLLPNADPSIQLAMDERDEAEMLAYFFALAERRFLVGFNVLDFDLPVLLRRALYLGVKAPTISLGRYRHPRVIDLMQELSYDGKLRPRSQSFYCKRFGLDAEDDDIESARIPELAALGRWREVSDHVRCDVLQVRGLAVRLGLWTT
jgi:hypothetical protein